MLTASAHGSREAQRRELRVLRRELTEGHRRSTGVASEPPIRVMTRLIRSLVADCTSRGFDADVVASEIVDRTIGDVDLRRVVEFDGNHDYRELADDMGVALPGERISGRLATGRRWWWLRERMADAEAELLTCGYDPRVYDVGGLGNPVLRAGIAEDVNRAWGTTASVGQVALGLGATDCLDKVLRGVADRAAERGEEPGDLLFPVPGFAVPVLQSRSYGYGVHEATTSGENGFKLTGALLSEHLLRNPRITVVYLCVVSNPTATAYTAEEIGDLLDVVREVTGRGRRLWVLADVAYVGTGRPDEDERRMRALSADREVREQIVYIGSFSKTHCLTGERFGWVVFGSERVAVSLGPSWTNSVATLPGDWQLRYMAYRALFREDPGLPERVRALYRLRRRRLARQLRRLDEEFRLFDEVYDHDSTIYVWARLRAGEDGLTVFEKTGIAGIPGSTFGFTDDYIRFSIGIVPVPADE